MNDELMTWEEFQKIPPQFLKAPKEVYAAEHKMNPTQLHFFGHYKRFIENRIDTIILGHLKDELGNEQILDSMKNRLEKTLNES